MTASDPHILEADHAPTPFTAAEIRRGCPPGRRIRLFVEQAGGDARYRLSRFLSCDADGATLEVRRTNLEGAIIEPASTVRTTWRELQGHASFPASVTVIRREMIATPLGTSDCLCYQVDRGDSVERFWFDTSRPGMPIRFTHEENGSVLTSTTMVEDTFE